MSLMDHCSLAFYYCIKCRIKLKKSRIIYSLNLMIKKTVNNINNYTSIITYLHSNKANII